MPADPRALLRSLEAAGATLAVAESLTGGLLGAQITSVPGASRVFRGGVIAYASDAKSSVLGVPAVLLAERGAVDGDVALAMAGGVRDLFASTYGVALTGVAGPDEQDGRPPGTVFVAVVGPQVGRVEALALSGDRQAIRTAAADRALELLADVLATTVG